MPNFPWSRHVFYQYNKSNPNFENKTLKDYAKSKGSQVKESSTAQFHEKVFSSDECKTVSDKETQIGASYNVKMSSTDLNELVLQIGPGNEKLTAVIGRTRTKSMFNELNWLSIKQQIERDVLVFIYKVMHGLLPQYLANCFQSNEGRSYVLRNHGDLRLTLYRKSATQRSLMFDGVKLYNDIPSEIRRRENLKNFKNYCSELLKSENEAE